MSDTNRVSLSAVEESVYKETPLTPAFQAIPIASTPNLAFTPTTVVSELLRADRQISDLILTGGSSGGDANSELAFGIYDDFTEGAFFDTWQDRLKWDNRETAEISAVDADSYTVTDKGSALVAGDLVFAEGFTIPGNNGLKTVDGATTNVDVVVTTALTIEVPGVNAKLSHVGVEAGVGDIAATVSPNSLTSTVLDFTTLALEPGDWILIQGFTTEIQNNDYVRVVSIAANVLLIDRVPDGWAADAGAGDTVQLFLGERIKNGVLRRSYTLERIYNDHTPVTYEYLRGQIVDGLTFTAAPQAVVTNGVTFLGADQFYSDADDNASQIPTDASGRAAGATDIPAPRFEVFNSSSNVGRIARGGDLIEGKNFVIEASISIANNLREKPAVGVLGAADVGAGEFGVTGSLSAYFDDKSLAVDVVNNTESSFDIRFRDSVGRAQVWDVPRLKFSEGAPEVPGKNEDVTIPLQYQGLLDETLGYTLKLMRYHYVPE